MPTKNKGFCARLGPRVKKEFFVRAIGIHKEKWGSHACFRDKFPSIYINKNADQHFSKKKEGKDISSQISLEFAFTSRKTNTF